MDKSIGIGLIVGLIVAIGSWVNSSNKFTSTQKKFLLPFLLFPPLGILLIIVVWLSNEYNKSPIKFSDATLDNNLMKSNNIQEVDISPRKSESANNSAINNSSTNDIDLANSIFQIDKKIILLESSFQQGILTKDEYDFKSNTLNIEREKLTQQLDDLSNRSRIISENKDVFLKLEELKNSGLISHDEYLIKIDLMLNSFQINNIDVENYDDSNLKYKRDVEIQSNKHNIFGCSIPLLIYAVVLLLVLLYVYEIIPS